MPRCEGSCPEHDGPVLLTHVKHPAHDWGTFYYCDVARAEDLSRGLSVVVKEEDVMNEKKWVQHISGQGEKWEVDSVLGDNAWRVFAKNPNSLFHYLPMSEYVECNPPEQWEKVAVSISGSRVLYMHDTPLPLATLSEGFRWAHSGDGVIVERRKL